MMPERSYPDFHFGPVLVHLKGHTGLKLYSFSPDFQGTIEALSWLFPVH